MRAHWLPGALAALVLSGCSSPQQPAARAPAKAETVRITQFYTTTPQVPRGEKGMVCYGVENAKSVWLSPPRRELSAAIARCVEVEPSGHTNYTLTAQGADGRTATQDLALGSGPPQVRVVNVDISAAEVKQGESVSICYKVENAQFVTIEPVHFYSADRHGCKIDQPAKTTTYVVTATGASGDTDQEKVTIKVQGR